MRFIKQYLILTAIIIMISAGLTIKPAYASVPLFTDTTEIDMTVHKCINGKITTQQGEIVQTADELGYIACIDGESGFEDFTKPSAGATPIDKTDQEKDSGLATDDGIKHPTSETVRESDALHLYLNLPSGNHKPSLILEATNLTTKKTVKQTVNVQNYNEAKYGMAYYVEIKGFPYKTNDRIKVKVLEMDKAIKQLSLQVLNRGFILDKQKPSAYFKAVTVVGQSDEGTEELNLLGSQYAPLVGTLKENPDYVWIGVKDEENNPIPNTGVEIENSYTGKKEVFETDEDGMILVPEDLLEGGYKVHPDGYEKVEQSEPFRGDDSVDNDYTHRQEIQFTEDKEIQQARQDALDKLDSVNKGKKGTHTVEFKVNGDTRLSTGWIKVKVKYKESQMETSLDYTKKTFNLPKEHTIKEIVSDYAKIEGYKLEGTKLTITVSPKYTLQIWNDGKDYDLTILNTDPELNLKGNKKIVFGIMPNATYTVKNNTTGKSNKVRASDDNTAVELSAKYGVTKGGSASAPHTNVWITVWGILLICTIVAGVGYWYYLKQEKRKKIAKNTTFSILIGLLIGSSLAPYGVSANSGSNIGGVDGTGNAGGTMPANILNYTSDVAVMEVYFVTSDSLSKNFFSTNADVNDLTTAVKYDTAFRKNAVYFTTDEKSYNAINRPKSGIINFNLSGGMNSRFRVLNGHNAMITNLQALRLEGAQNLTDPTAGNTSQAEKDKRVISPSGTVRGQTYNGTGAIFVNAVQSGIREASTRTSTSGTSFPLSGAIGNRELGNDPYGSAVGNYLKKTYVGEEDQKKEARRKFFKAYVELLDAKGIVKKDSPYIAKLTTAFEQGKAVMVINTLTGITLSSATSTSPYAFMSMYDAMEWAKWLGVNYGSRNGQTKSRAHVTLKEHQTADNLYRPQLNGSVGYKVNGNIQFTMHTWARDYYVHTIQPTSSKISESKSSSTNPFGGWGYVFLGAVESEVTPRLMAKVNYKLKGTVIHTEEPEGFKHEDNRTFVRLYNGMTNRIAIKPEIEVNGKIYEVVTEGSINVTSKDVKGVGSSCDIKNMEELLNYKGITGKKGSPVTGQYDEIVTSSNNLLIGNYVNAHFLHLYLGGSADKVTKLQGVDAPKYKTETGKEPCFADMRVLVDVEVQEVDTTLESEKLEIPQWSLTRYFEDIVVPRANYGSFGNGSIKLYFNFDTSSIRKLTGYSRGYKANHTKTDYVLKLKYKDIATHYKKLWLVDYGYVLDKYGNKEIQYEDELKTHSTTSSPSALGEKVEVKGGMDALAVKTRKGLAVGGVQGETIDSLNLADWVDGNNNLSYDSTISEGNKGVRIELKDKPHTEIVKHKEKQVTIDNVEMSLESLMDNYSVYQTAKKDYSCGTEKEPRTCTQTLNSTTAVKLEPVKPLPTLTATFVFNKYNPAETLELNTLSKIKRKMDDNPQKALSEVSDFSARKVIQDKRKLKIYPEVPMLVEENPDPLRQTEADETVQYAIGEKERIIEPFIAEDLYLQIKEGSNKIEIEAAVTGAEATSAVAKTLSNHIKGRAENYGLVRPVLNKGTTTTNSIQMHNGEMVYTIGMLEYKEERLKQKWLEEKASTDEYNTDKIREKILNKVAPINPTTGKREAKAKAEGYYYVGNKPYSKTKKEVVFKMRGKELLTYDLIIRGGYLESVMTEDDVTYTYTDLKEYFTKPEKCKYQTAMKADEKRSIACNLLSMYVVPVMDNTEEGVFYGLERKTGDKLKKNREGTYEEYIKLANEERGVLTEQALVKVKQVVGEGWYMEDTTIMQLELAKHYFEIPSMMWTAKTPLEYSMQELVSPQDKSKFYTKGIASNIGYTVTWGDEAMPLALDINTALFPYKGGNVGSSGIVTRSPYDYITPNVSVMDAMY